jgi:hypothetical protein
MASIRIERSALKRLSDENTALKAELATLKAERSARPVALVPTPMLQRNLVTELAPAASSFVMPTEGELGQLFVIVNRAYPELYANSNMDADSKGENHNQFRAQTRDCFIALSYWRRTPAPDRKHYCSFWMEEAAILLRSLGRSPGDIKLGPFMMAVLCHGDICFTGLRQCSGNIYWPLSIGLDKYSGAEATDAWKTVLANGKPLEQRSPPPAPGRDYQPKRPVVQLLPEYDDYWGKV